MPTDAPDFVPDDTFIAAVRHGVRRHRRSTRQRLGAGAALVAVLAGSGIWYANDRLSSVQRIDLGTDPTVPDPVVEGTPFNLLVVGLDQCLAPDDAMCANRLGLAPPTERGLADSIVVVHVDPGAETLDVLGVPRDLLADGNAKWSGLSIGQIRDHLHEDLGITVDHTMTITMSGFRDLANDQSIRLALGTAVQDRTTGLDLEAGCQEIDGSQLLALVRARHLTYLDGGAWTSDPTGDVGRMTRQQQVLRAVFDQVRQLDLTDAGTLDGLLDSIAVDDGLTNADLLRLARQARSATLRSTATLPTRLGGNASMSFATLGDAATVNPVVAPFGGHVTDRPDAPTSTVSPGMESIVDGLVGWSDISPC